jgi:hypothetical protein
MRKYAIFLILAAIFLIVAGAGCTSKKSENSQQGSNAADKSTSTRSIIAKEVDNPFPVGYIAKMQSGIVEYYRSPKDGFTTEFGDVGIPSSIIDGDGLMTNFDNISDD